MGRAVSENRGAGGRSRSGAQGAALAGAGMATVPRSACHGASRHPSLLLLVVLGGGERVVAVLHLLQDVREVRAHELRQVLLV